MKKIFLTCLAGATVLSAQAQLFGPESWNGALFGSLIGGIVGSDRHHGFSGEGAAIGAGVGLLAGAIAGEARRQNYYAQPYVCAPPPTVSYGYGYSSVPVCSTPYVYCAPNSYCAPGYYYRPTRPNYAAGGTLLGAASGALIGAGEHRPGEGAAIGAAAGLVLGSVAEVATQKREQQVVAAQTVPASPAYDPETPTQPQQSQIAPGRPDRTSQACKTKSPCIAKKNSAPQPVFHQIPDAPRVPEAPTF